MKTEPETFSIDDLMKAPGKTTDWEGVRNYQARNFMRDEFEVGDEVLIYHSNTDEPAAVGVAIVAKKAYPDKYALDKKSDYYDEDAVKKGVNPWVLVDVKGIEKFSTPVTRTLLKENKATATMVVMQKGSRLSIQPVQPTEFEAVVKMGRK